MKKYYPIMGILVLGIAFAPSPGLLLGQTSAADEARPSWTFGLGGGYIGFEGDEATKDGGFVNLRLGYNYSPRWTLESQFYLMPYLKANPVYNYDHGYPEPRQGLDAESTFAAGIAADARFHFNAAENRRWDPYAAGGLGTLAWQRHRAHRSDVDVTLRAGAGLAYHLNNAWAVRADVIGLMTLDRQEFNYMPSLGVDWTWAARGRKPVLPAGGWPVAAGPVAEPVKPPAPPPAPDLQTFELDMNFAEGEWHPEYLPELDAIAKAIQAHPDSEVWIEGHMDQQPNMAERDARKLTEQRAEEVRDYFVKKYNIAKKRLTAVGYGFSRPRAPNNPATGNPANRRMEVHIRPAPAAP